MESASITISNKKPSSVSLDFEELRKIGIEHIQSIAGKVWTDYNLHDPGINTLEVLAYAITDLANRAKSDIDTVIASSSSGATDSYYTAADILPNYPVTIKDFRKLLIDLEEIKNAWIEIADESEIDISLDQENGSISYGSGEKIEVRGLYKVLLEFNEQEIQTAGSLDPKVVDINNNVLIHPPIDVSGTPIQIEIAFPFWDQVPNTWGTDINIDQVMLEVQSSGTLVALGEDQGDDYFAIFVVDYNGGETYRFGITIRVNNDNTSLSTTDIETAIIDALELTPAEIASDPSIIDSSLIKEFNRRVVAAFDIIATVKSHLHQHRNLCEDFLAFTATRVQEVAINAQLEIYSNSDVELLLARLFFELDKFISPDVKQYSLTEMLDKGKTVDQIFEGPLLKNGFIDSDEIDEENRNDILYTSDLLRVMLNQNDLLLSLLNNKVISINDLKISNYINNQALTVNVRNCLSLTQSETYKPRLNLEKSSIRVFKSNREISYDINTVIDHYLALKFESSVADQVLPEDLPIPLGEKTDLTSYDTIQNHFPANYGIGEEGIVGLEAISDKKDKDFRKAQARQFKAYLLFFEQLMANYLAQLNNMGNLFSFDPNLTDTYFSQPLYQIPEVEPLYKDFTDSTNNWSDYTQDDANSYIQFLQQSMNDNGGSLERKNRFLNHLLGRFAEEFIEYGIIQVNDGKEKDLIYDKTKFLSNYPQLSSQRFVAHNYLQLSESTPDVWDSVNVSGLQKRITSKLGIKSQKSRNLINAMSAYFNIIPDGAEFQGQLVDDDSALRLTTTNQPSIIAAQGIRREVIAQGLSKDNLKVVKELGAFQGCIVNATNDIIAWVEGSFITEADAYKAVDSLFEFIHEKFSGEGLFIVEHLLLRPKRTEVSSGLTTISDSLLEGVKTPDETYHSPYSFYISVILPSGYTDDTLTTTMRPQRFRNEDFRSLAEKVIRQETPSHIKPNIYWVNNDVLQQFELVHQAWLENLADPAITDEDAVIAQNDMVSQLTLIINNG